MKRLLLLLGSVLIPLVGVILVRTVRYRSVQPAVQPAPQVAVPDGAAERLAGAVRIPTISHENPADFDAGAFQALHAYLAAQFPRVHSQLRRETVANHSLMYTWPGNDSSLKPILLMGHLDVVPVEPGTEQKWAEEPFSGRIANGFVWGRGAIDNKLSVLGILEAVEMLRVVDDPRVEVRRAGGFSAEPAVPSSTGSESFRILERTIRSVAPEATVAPYPVVVITDARFYRELTPNVFRFMPVRLTSEDLQRMHGTNERIAVREYERAIRVYRQLIRNTARTSDTTTPGRARRSTGTAGTLANERAQRQPDLVLDAPVLLLDVLEELTELHQVLLVVLPLRSVSLFRSARRYASASCTAETSSGR